MCAESCPDVCIRVWR
ncbi:MAG: hypothetical protein ACXWW2_09835 [Candidatus Deferrimicrobiaceae bacterium]